MLGTPLTPATAKPLTDREQSGSVGPDAMARAGHRAPGGGEGGGGFGKVRQAGRRPRGSEVWGAELWGGPEGLWRRLGGTGWWARGGPQLGVPSLSLPAPLPPWALGQEGYQLGLQPGLVILNGGKRCSWPGRGRGCGPGRLECSEVGCVCGGVCIHCWGVHLGVGVTGSVCDSSSGWRLGIQAGVVGPSERLPPSPPVPPFLTMFSQLRVKEDGGEEGATPSLPITFSLPLGVRPCPSLPLPRVCPACAVCLLPVPAAS